jgi:choline kinase
LGDPARDLPKCLLSINGQSSLERYRRSFERAGVVDGVIVVGGYRIDALREHLPPGFELITNERYDSTNSLYSLWLALESVGNEDIAVFNADVVYEADLLGRYLRSPRRTALLVDELKSFDEREYQVRLVDGLVRELSLRVPASESFGQDAQTFRVAREHIPLVKNYARQELESGGTDRYAGLVLSALANAGLLSVIYTNQQQWGEFDTEEDYRRCVDLIADIEGKAPEYESYGLSDDTRSAEPDDGPVVAGRAGVMSPRHFARRLYQCIVERELPGRLKWLPDLAAALRRSPWRAIRNGHLLATSSLSVAGVRLQVYGHELLRAVMSEAGDLGIRPFLLWGTLLGCVRDGGFIPNDHDVDMGLLDADFRHVPELKRRMLARGFKVRAEDPGKISFRHPRVPGLWVDIDRIHESREHLWSINSGSDEPAVFSYWFSRDSLKTLEPRQLDGVRVFVPGGAEAVLTAIYGMWRIRQAKKSFLRGPLNLMLWNRAAMPW